MMQSVRPTVVASTATVPLLKPLHCHALSSCTSLAVHGPPGRVAGAPAIVAHRMQARRHSMMLSALPGDGSKGSGEVKEEIKKKGITTFKVIGWLTYVPGIYIVCSFLYRYYVRHF